MRQCMADKWTEPSTRDHSRVSGRRSRPGERSAPPLKPVYALCSSRVNEHMCVARESDEYNFELGVLLRLTFSTNPTM